MLDKYNHEWWPSIQSKMLVDRCRWCGIIRRLDGKSDGGICSGRISADVCTEVEKT